MKWVMDALKGDSAYERIPHILGASLQDVEGRLNTLLDLIRKSEFNDRFAFLLLFFLVFLFFQHQLTPTPTPPLPTTKPYAFFP